MNISIPVKWLVLTLRTTSAHTLLNGETVPKHPKPTAKKEEDAAGYTRESFLSLLKRAIKTPALKPHPKAK
ncbi:MAG TPA: hypothetical protein VG892_03535 [Terriglobales bacterium]|nr:hypothetical protein [Terriglobales bacterium]